jgi:hypothetical protein
MTQTNHPHLDHKPQPLLEALSFKDLDGMVKPTIHVDEFAAKMGDDEDIVVVSFFVRSKLAAEDLVTWFEKGYDFVLDADRSPGEISPGRYLVYVEMRRRSSVPKNVATMLDDLSTLTEYSANGWHMTYNDREVPFTEENFTAMVPLSPKEYKKRVEKDLNEWRVAAGIPPRDIFEREHDIRKLQSAAGI